MSLGIKLFHNFIMDSLEFSSRIHLCPSASVTPRIQSHRFYFVIKYGFYSHKRKLRCFLTNFLWKESEECIHLFGERSRYNYILLPNIYIYIYFLLIRYILEESSNLTFQLHLVTSSLTMNLGFVLTKSNITTPLLF